MSFKIVGTGSAVPQRIVTNDDLSQFLETSDEWIRSRTGIGERRILTTESISQLASVAAERALQDAGIDGSQVDLIIGTTSKSDYQFPSMAYIVGQHIGAKGLAFDINAVCTGFVTALDMAHAYISTGKARTVLVVSAEAMSHVVDWTDRNTCVLFGDAAGAVVLQPGDGYIASAVSGEGNPEPLYAYSNKGNSPFMEPLGPGVDNDIFCHMAGKDVFKFAVQAICSDVEGLLAQTCTNADEVDYYILHQANGRITEAARQRLNQPIEKFPSNIERFGNTSSASIPLLLDELNRAGKLAPGDTLVLSAFGAGLMSGACILEWVK